MTYPNPVGRDPDSRALRARMQRQDLRDIAPWDAVDGGTEDEHVEEEESHRRGRGRVLVGVAFEAEQDGHHHHANPQAE